MVTLPPLVAALGMAELGVFFWVFGAIGINRWQGRWNKVGFVQEKMNSKGRWGGRLEIEDWRLEIGDWRLEIGDWRLKIED